MSTRRSRCYLLQIRILENETKEGGPTAATKRKMNAQVAHART